jgi:hypothetical protein
MNIVEYKARNGNMQFRPADVETLEELDDNGEGLCLACGAVAYNVEPDAHRYECECCGANKVYGSEGLGMIFGMFGIFSDSPR